MRYSDMTGIGRPLDPRYPTNLAILFLSFLVTFIMAIISFLGDPQLVASVVEGVRGGITFFLGWAIAREIDPDHPYAAFLSALAILVVHILGFISNLLFLAFLLLMLRYINRSTGKAATVIDLAVGLSLTAWLAWTTDWIIGVLAAFGYALDGFLAQKHRIRILFSLISLLIAMGSLVWGPTEVKFVGINSQFFSLAILITMLSLPIYFSSSEIASVCDFTNEPLHPERIRWAQVFYLVSTLIIGLKLGLQNSGDMLAAGSIIAGTSVYYLFSRLHPIAKRQ